MLFENMNYKRLPAFLVGKCHLNLASYLPFWKDGWCLAESYFICSQNFTLVASSRNLTSDKHLSSPPDESNQTCSHFINRASFFSHVDYQIPVDILVFQEYFCKILFWHSILAVYTFFSLKTPVKRLFGGILFELRMRKSWNRNSQEATWRIIL